MYSDLISESSPFRKVGTLVPLPASSLPMDGRPTDGRTRTKGKFSFLGSPPWRVPAWPAYQSGQDISQFRNKRYMASSLGAESAKAEKAGKGQSFPIFVLLHVEEKPFRKLIASNAGVERKFTMKPFKCPPFDRVNAIGIYCYSCMCISTHFVMWNGLTMKVGCNSHGSSLRQWTRTPDNRVVPLLFLILFCGANNLCAPRRSHFAGCTFPKSSALNLLAHFSRFARPARFNLDKFRFCRYG
jgi:hypothetical protein